MKVLINIGNGKGTFAIQKGDDKFNGALVLRRPLGTSHTDIEMIPWLTEEEYDHLEEALSALEYCLYE